MRFHSGEVEQDFDPRALNSTQVSTAVAPTEAPAPPARPPITRRRGLPGGRAVVGGFLVALSLVAIFAGYTRATTDPQVMFVVARNDLTVGDVITREDLALVPMDLPAAITGSRAFTSADSLVGATVLGPIAKGELVQAGAVLRRAGGTSSGPQVSLALPSSRAVGGSLVAGELVDVLATYGTGVDAYTVTVVREARVVRVDETGGALSDGASLVVTLAVASHDDARAVSHSASAGEVSVVRSDGNVSGGDSYRTPLPDES